MKLEEKASAADNEMVAETPLFSNEVGTAQGRTAYQNKRRDGHSLPSCNDTCVWKDDVMKRINELEAANKAADYEFKRVKAENDVLTKEIGRLRHLEQIRTVPQQVQPVIAKFHYADPIRTGHGQSPRTLSGPCRVRVVEFSF